MVTLFSLKVAWSAKSPIADFGTWPGIYDTDYEAVDLQFNTFAIYWIVPHVSMTLYIVNIAT